MKYVHSPLFTFQCLVQGLLIALFGLWERTAVEQAILCGVLLCSVGIPHGANDHLYRQSTTFLGLLAFIGIYLGSMGVYLSIWWIAPAAALLIFFAISLHHFGQSNFENPSVWYLPSLLWGTWLLAFPVMLHWEEALDIFGTMVGRKSVHFPIPQIVRLGVAAALTVCYFGALLRYERQNTARYVLQWMVVTAWYWLTPLLFGFIMVFCLWHSLQSLQHQLTYYKATKKGTFRQFTFALLPFGLLALTGFGLYVYFRGFAVGEAFILLSLITLPHIVVMHRLYGAFH
ncbi:Brp/Blh family beta-carotene 15,15'-dioxygenase [Runella slithyformis]|uniref:Beta-carotene 15,15'-monooxygenase, Brp/Blh family n=1 Tax=Runella slithyformis (strain ATCC 29530 / DSM 19594 / LMG 11500 / NCIMB 11436 / LSU 4) TaxID=761193 RepID=A0A7U4E3S0_RUNSL|nr:Brp/Blh family beta-carotene 15,15'-dioxygenase [Runella slithyformis]AEI46691.1 beta-carotene 15,15'-monooxygenase, Brp/Blh family [Runella slithyformis DSM 19594]